MSQTASLAAGLAAGAPLDPTSFAGVLNITQLPQALGDLEKLAVIDDLDGQDETVPDFDLGDLDKDLDGNRDLDAHALHVEDLLKAVNDVSRGVSDKTHDEYQRYVPYLPAGHAHC